MSREDAQSFLKRLEHDAVLRQAATKAAEGDDAPRLIAVGAEHGLSFTASELVAAVDERSLAVERGDLGDAELESVAGGLTQFSPLLEKLRQIAKSLLVDYL
jgi:predicted ribosomally synthesized peptide with nif11-like leader